MCPICIATAAWIYAGAGSAGGLAALLVNKHRSKLHSKTDLHLTNGFFQTRTTVNGWKGGNADRCSAWARHAQARVNHDC
jgi:hypothetical protein